MVTEKDIINMGRKIKRSSNPKTLARYQAQIDAWIAELNSDLTQTQADILALEEKIKMEEEAKAAQSIAGGDRKSEEYKKSISAPESPSDSKKVAVKIAEQMIPLEEKIKMEEEARAAQTKGDNQYTKSLPAQKSESLNNSKEQAKKIAEKAGVSPRKCYSYFEFERLHLRRSS